MDNENCNVAVYPKSTWRDKLRRFFFPINICIAPPIDFDTKDMIITKTVADFSWIDRIRILFVGHLVVETKTATENVIGKTATSCSCHVATKKMI